MELEKEAATVVQTESQNFTEEVVKCLLEKEESCSQRFEELIDLDQRLNDLSKKLQEKEEALHIHEEIILLVEEGYDLQSLVKQGNERRESELKIKKLTSDLYRVQNKLYKAYSDIASKDREISVLNQKVKELEGTYSENSNKSSILFTSATTEHENLITKPTRVQLARRNTVDSPASPQRRPSELTPNVSQSKLSTRRQTLAATAEYTQVNKNWNNLNEEVDYDTPTEGSKTCLLQ